jgi:hypothetical protein
VPPPATKAAEPEPPKTFAQVYIDAASKVYYPEGCEHPANAVRMSKGAALHQRYTLASTCPP